MPTTEPRLLGAPDIVGADACVWVCVWGDREKRNSEEGGVARLVPGGAPTTKTRLMGGADIVGADACVWVCVRGRW